jgi:beta-glucanase (GH16 family)
MRVCLRYPAAALLFLLMPAGACAGQQSPASASTVSPTPVPAGWTLAFADEFTTPGPPDASKWGYELGYIRNNEAQFYTSRAENVRVENGLLVIEGRREDYQGYRYTSASINTLGRFEFRYGRVEVRAKLPSGLGTWPAIWTLGVNRAQVGWPTCGEIDIMENVGFDPLRIVGSVHTAAYNHTIGTHKSASTTVANPAEAFHVYAMEWFPDRIDIFVDGLKYFSFANEGTGARAWPFDQPQYLLVNLAIGGSWGGQRGIDDTRFPHRYEVDYVRVYQSR